MTVTRTRGRSDSYPFSLSEIPLLLGLFFAAPVDLVTAQIAGATVALLLHRQSPLRVGFTVCSLTLQVLVAALAFHSVALAQDPTSTQALTAAGLAVLAFDGLNLLLIEAAVWLSSGSPDTGRLSYAAVLSLLGVLGNGSLAVLVLTLLWKEPTALWMVVAPTMILCFAYRAYMQERERHDRVEFLFESSRILQRSMDIDDNASALVEHARQMFRAEIAEMVLLPLAGEGPVLRSTIGPGDSAETAHMLREQLPNDLLSLVGEQKK